MASCFRPPVLGKASFLACNNEKDLCMLLIRMFRRKLKRVGIRGLFVDGIGKLAALGDRRGRRIKREGKGFDARYGIETTDYVPFSSFDVTDTEAAGAGSYRPTPIELLDTIFNGLGIDFSRFTFIDFGSGKGRTLLLASKRPFRKIIGVEFSRKLHEIAKGNILRYKEKNRCACEDIESILSNATIFPIPSEPCVFYFFNPFQFDIMKAVVSNIESSLTAVPREAHLVYLKPECPEAVEKGTSFSRRKVLELPGYEYSCFLYTWKK